MTINDILSRLVADGYEGCHVAHWDPKSIIVPKLGEVELAYGEAKVFDKKHPWPHYGEHQCFKNIDDLFADIHATWPLESETSCETSSTESLPYSEVDVAEIVIKADEPAIVSEPTNDPESVESESVQACAEASAICVGLDAERAVTSWH